MQIINLSDKKNDPIFALVYGASGTGKTHLMGTVGALGRVLLIDVDQGVKTIQYAAGMDKYTSNIVAVSFDQFKDLDEAYKLVNANDPCSWWLHRTYPADQCKYAPPRRSTRAFPVRAFHG